MDIPVFVPPEYAPATRRVATIPFKAAIGANTQLTIVSFRIPFPFKITHAEVTFRDDAANNLQVYILVANNRNTSTTGVPPDPNVFSQYSSTPYFIGEGVVQKADCNVQAPDGYYYLKVHGVNNNAYAQTINATVTIEEVTTE